MKPTTYKKEFCITLLEHLSDGGAISTFPAVLYQKHEVMAVRATVYSWIDKHIEFALAKELGVSLSEKHWMQKAIDQMANPAKGWPQSTWIFVMKNRFSWRDKTEITGADGGPLDLQTEREKVRQVLKNPKLAKAAVQIARAASDARKRK